MFFEECACIHVARSGPVQVQRDGQLFGTGRHDGNRQGAALDTLLACTPDEDSRLGWVPIWHRATDIFVEQRNRKRCVPVCRAEYHSLLNKG